MTVSSPTSSLEAVRRRISDTSPDHPLLSVEQLDDAIQTAVAADYSRLRPRNLTVALPGDGPYIAVEELSGWAAGASTVSVIEYPAVEVGSAAPSSLSFLGPSDWTMYNDGDTLYLVLVGRSPLSTELVRVTFGAPHTHTSDLDTVPAADLPAVLDQAAANACGYLALKAAHQEDGTVLADGIQRGNSADRYRRMGDFYQERFAGAMGRGDQAVIGAASVSRPWPMEQSILQSRRGWLTH